MRGIQQEINTLMNRPYVLLDIKEINIHLKQLRRSDFRLMPYCSPTHHDTKTAAIGVLLCSCCLSNILYKYVKNVTAV